jgi:hypothetical protein
VTTVGGRLVHELEPHRVAPGQHESRESAEDEAASHRGATLDRRPRLGQAPAHYTTGRRESGHARARPRLPVAELVRVSSCSLNCERLAEKMSVWTARGHEGVWGRMG